MVEHAYQMSGLGGTCQVRYLIGQSARKTGRLFLVDLQAASSQQQPIVFAAISAFYSPEYVPERNLETPTAPKKSILKRSLTYDNLQQVKRKPAGFLRRGGKT